MSSPVTARTTSRNRAVKAAVTRSHVSHRLFRGKRGLPDYRSTEVRLHVGGEIQGLNLIQGKGRVGLRVIDHPKFFCRSGWSKSIPNPSSCPMKNCSIPARGRGPPSQLGEIQLGQELI